MRAGISQGLSMAGKETAVGQAGTGRPRPPTSPPPTPAHLSLLPLVLFNKFSLFLFFLYLFPPLDHHRVDDETKVLF